ncbi:MAG: TRAP transporter substrate-binding protein DctP [Chloroflexota bacterium]|nr:TRAP transporter substrate-binding protein DctP [Chloroflexota bacterium]MDE2959575.1 TRAP transporter substrate-binding protein DctP [Chloroflexota bacterium]
MPAAAPTQPAAAPAVVPTEPTLTQPAPTPQPPVISDLMAYADAHAHGPGAIYVGDATQLLGPPPHQGLMFGVPEAIYRQASAAAILGFEPAGIPDHLFIYNSDYYRDLIDKANLTEPTQLTSSGESIEIQHVCIDRNLPTCVLIQTYWAPNLWERTNGQVDLSVTSFVELGLAGPDTLSQVADGSLDMVNIFTGYVAGAHPSLEVQSLWGTATDWETSYSALADMAPDIDRMLLDITGGSPVLNRNWFAGSDQWFFSNQPMRSIGDFESQQIRTHSASMSDFIRGMGGEPVELSVGELYTALQIGTVDAAVTTLLLGVTGSLFEVADHIAGPVIGFGYTNNVINLAVWDDIPEDLQQIIIEEGAKAELEALRLAPFQNFIALEAAQDRGLEATPFSDQVQEHIQTVVLPEHVIPGWLRRLGYPGSGADAVAIYNAKSAPYTGLMITPDGSVEQVPITKGPRAQ